MTGGRARSATPPAVADRGNSSVAPLKNAPRTTSAALPSRSSSPLRGEEIVKAWGIPRKDMNDDPEWLLPKVYLTAHPKPDLPKAEWGSAVGVSNAFGHHHVLVRMQCSAKVHNEVFDFELNLYKQCQKSFNEKFRPSLKPGNNVKLNCSHHECITSYLVDLHPNLVGTKPDDLKLFQNFLEDSSPLKLNADTFETLSASQVCPLCRWTNAGKTRDAHLGNYRQHCQKDFDNWLYRNLVKAWVTMPEDELPTGDIEQWKWAFGKLLRVRHVEVAQQFFWHNERWKEIREAYDTAVEVIKAEERKKREAARKEQKKANLVARQDARKKEADADQRFRAQMRERVEKQEQSQAGENAEREPEGSSQGLVSLTKAFSWLSPSKAASRPREHEPLLARQGRSPTPPGNSPLGTRRHSNSPPRTRSNSPRGTYIQSTAGYGTTSSGSTSRGHKGKGRGHSSVE